MRWRYRNHLVLALAVAGCAAYLTLAPQPKSTLSERVPLTALNPEGVTRIELNRQSQPALVLERNDDRWWLSAPFRHRADEFKVRTLSSILNAPARRIAIGTQGLSEYGLAPPLLAARFDETLLTIGATEPVNHRRYVAINDTVMLIDDRWYVHLLATPHRFADPRLIPPAAKLAGITFENGDGWRQVNGRWRAESADANSHARDASPSASAGTPDVVAAWHQARALAVSAIDSALPWSDGPTLFFSDGREPLAFRIARKDRMVFLAQRQPPLQFHFSARAFSKLDVRKTQPSDAVQR